MSILPWIHRDVTNFLQEKIDKNTKILEFGSGNSTIYFSKLTNNLISIEHNKDWYNKIKPQLNSSVKYILSYVDYVPHLPTDKKFYNCDTIEELLEADIPDEYFDIIIIDGIDRVNCAYGSVNKLKKGGVLILDDSNRIQHSLEIGDGSYMPIKLLTKEWEEHKFRSNDRCTDYWIKP